MRYMTNTVAVAQKPLVCLSDAVGIHVLAVLLSSLMQASEAITTSMTHPFGMQTVAKAKYKRSFLAKNSFAWPPPFVTSVFQARLSVSEHKNLVVFCRAERGVFQCAMNLTPSET